MVVLGRGVFLMSEVPLYVQCEGLGVRAFDFRYCVGIGRRAIPELLEEQSVAVVASSLQSLPHFRYMGLGFRV